MFAMESCVYHRTCVEFMLINVYLGTQWVLPLDVFQGGAVQTPIISYANSDGTHTHVGFYSRGGQTTDRRWSP